MIVSLTIALYRK